MRIQPAFNGTNRFQNQLPSEGNEIGNQGVSDDSSTKVAVESKSLQKRRIRNVTLSLNIGLGGVGVLSISQLKKVNEELDTKQFMSYLGLDTDSASQSGSTKGIALRDGEFVQLSTSRIRNVVDNPKSHRDACYLLGLDDQNEMAFVERLCNDRVEHAGQVRKYGLLAYLSNCLSIRAEIKKKISDLTSNLKLLQRQLDHKLQIRIKGKLVVNLVFSLVGGTGSSLILPVTSMVRELTKDIDVEIRGFGFLPSCFDGKQDGKADNSLRIQGNGYMTLTEINAAQTGVLARERIKIGNDARDQVAIPATLFHRFYVAGRDRADGKTMDSLDAIIDATVIQLLALTSSEIADRADADEANTSTSNFTTDRQSGHLRYVRSFGALALALPVNRLAKHCAAKQMTQVLRKNVLGSLSKPDDLLEQTLNWMSYPVEDPKLRLHDLELANSLARACLPNCATVTRPLYAAVSGNNRAYHRNGIFAGDALRLEGEWRDGQLPAIQARLAELSAHLSKELIQSLNKMLDKTRNEQGLESELAKLLQLKSALNSIVDRLVAEASKDAAIAQKALSQLKVLVLPLKYWPSALFATKSKQDAAILQFQMSVSSSVSQYSKLAALRVLQTMIANLEERRISLVRRIHVAKRQLEFAQATAESNRSGKRLTTESTVELDVATAETDRRVFDADRLEFAAFSKLMSEWHKVPANQLISWLSEQAENVGVACASVQEYFLGRLADYSIDDELATQLACDVDHEHADVLLRQGVVGGQPMWRAESKQNNITFTDSMIIGLPEALREENRIAVQEHLQSNVSARIHANGQYTGNVEYVETGDKHRIYIVRQVSGACLHYLPDVAEAKLGHDRWVADRGHSLSLLNARLTSKYPTILPSEDSTDAELAFALGVAYGWIANRGPRWYDNLERMQNEPTKLVCRLASHWNCLAFNKGNRIDKSESLEKMVASYKLQYICEHDPSKAMLVGQSLLEAFETVHDNGELVEQIMATFGDMRILVGDVVLAEELEEYVSDTRRRTRPGDAEYGLIQKMIDQLDHFANQLLRREV